MKKTLAASAVLTVAGLLAAACGSSTSNSSGSSSVSAKPSGSSSSASTAGKFLGCMVTDTGGIDDRSFNASSWQGMQQAASASSGKISVKYLQSTTQSDYTPNINTFIGDKCGIIVTVGFLMAQATQTASKANASAKFAIVDNAYTPALKNVDALLFNTVQDAFLGGYLAAGMSKTGKVATFGGEKLPTVTIYMDGYYDGVQYYNQKHGTHVSVLGWNETSQNGSFTGNFTDQTAGQNLTQTFINEGADIIFPVAGNVGLGSAKAVQNADAAAGSQKVNMEWVDTDGCISAAQYCKYFITSVTKGIQTAVKNAVTTASNGSFKGGNYIGTLANGGVALSPFHDFASKVPSKLQSELKTVKTGIISGSIKTPTKSPA
ncbi:MAG TPA: BMP family ABC transporter substrate-binding protein [Streptosporangiaceae bacterium]|nr:BMP family ABC transporter substrate-binding protein [Streptosporangiaceae bacterium]